MYIPVPWMCSKGEVLRASPRRHCRREDEIVEQSHDGGLHCLESQTTLALAR